ncbi:calcium-binding protein [Microvirga sp. 0TCS3.31]
MTIEKWGNWDLNKTLITAGSADQPVMAALPNGGYVVVWRQAERIHLQVFDAAGNPKPKQTVSSTDLAQLEPDVAVLDDGSIIVAWSSADRAIHRQKFRIDGTTDEPSFVIAPNVANTSIKKMFPAVATYGDSWAAAWQESDSTNATNTIKFERQNSDGSKSQVTVAANSSVANPEVTELVDGRHVVTWVQNGGSGAEIHAAIINANGSVTQIGKVADGQSASVTALSNGSFVFGIQGTSGLNGGTYTTKVYGFNNTGNPIVLDQDTLSSTGATYPMSVVALTKGGFLDGYAVVYSTPIRDNSGNPIDNGDIFIRLVRADGTPSEPFKINAGPGDQRIPSIAELPDGRISIAWHDPSASGIRHQIIDARLIPVTVEGTYHNDYYIGSKHSGDILYGREGNDTLEGGDGNDALFGGAGADRLDGGNGTTDTVSYKDAKEGANGAGVRVDLSNLKNNSGDAAGDTYFGIEVIDGSLYKDTLEGASGNDNFWADTGDDILKGRGGNDTLKGSLGADTFHGGADADFMEGDYLENGQYFDDGKVDTLTYVESTDAVTVDLEARKGTRGEALNDSFIGMDELYGSSKSDILYGRNTDGDSGESVNDTIWGGFGNDLIIGRAGNDQLDGGQDNDTLEGGEGADNLYGFTGDDLLIGGAGIDLLDGGEGNDTVSYANNAGKVRVELLNATTQTGLGTEEGQAPETLRSIENAIGGSNDDTLIGSDAGNSLRGERGNDSLEGGKGNDTLEGGLGNDTLRGGDNFDFASYANSAAGVTITLPGGGTGTVGEDTFELIEGLIGSSNGDTLTGNNDANHLKGEGADDVLNGGLGNDTLEGGTGSDVYYVSGRDRIVEHAGQGTDTVWITSDFVLTGNDFANVERIVLDVSTINNTVSGSEDANALTGNDVANILNGLGGNDVLSGLGGNDALYGGAGDDVLDGGLGIDRMEGGIGNDVYQVNDLGDQVVEAAGGGIDTVYASVNFDMGAGTEVEFVYATGSANVQLTGSNFANTIVGNAGANKISGGSGNDLLYGGAGNDKIYGGLGNDMLYGQTGKDTFVFNTRPSKTANVDKIYDFRYQDDSFQLDNRYFTKLGSGTESRPKKFNSDMFVTGTKAKDREDRIVYDKKTGNLYYDQDGTGSKAQVKIATIVNKTTLKFDDFFVI